MSPRWLHWPAAGLSLIVHDDFAGVAGTNISGRTPNQVNTPGNTWGTELNSSYYKISSGGDSAIAYSENSISGMFIDVGTTVFDIEAVTQATSSGSVYDKRHGIHIGYASPARSFSLIQIGNNGNTLDHIVCVSGSVTSSTTLHTFGSTVPTGTDIAWDLSVNGTSVSYSITVGGSPLASGSITSSIANGIPGWFARESEANGGSVLKDFKVYA